LLEFRPISSRLLQQAEGAIHIGTHKIVRPMDGTVHMTLGREVHDGTRTAASQKIAHQFSVSDVSMYEGVPRIGRNRYQIAEIPGVGKLVKIHHRSSIGREPLQNEVGTNKAGSSGHQNGLVYFQD
jgi:hypothetical protein